MIDNCSAPRSCVAARLRTTGCESPAPRCHASQRCEGHRGRHRLVWPGPPAIPRTFPTSPDRPRQSGVRLESGQRTSNRHQERPTAGTRTSPETPSGSSGESGSPPSKRCPIRSPVRRPRCWLRLSVCFRFGPTGRWLLALSSWLPPRCPRLPEPVTTPPNGQLRRAAPNFADSLSAPTRHAGRRPLGGSSRVLPERNLERVSNRSSPPFTRTADHPDRELSEPAPTRGPDRARAKAQWLRSRASRRMTRQESSPASPGLAGLQIWCAGAESNCRHPDFQSGALPPELPAHGASNQRSAHLARGQGHCQVHRPRDLPRTGEALDSAGRPGPRTVS